MAPRSSRRILLPPVRRFRKQDKRSPPAQLLRWLSLWAHRNSGKTVLNQPLLSILYTSSFSPDEDVSRLNPTCSWWI